MFASAHAQKGTDDMHDYVTVHGKVKFFPYRTASPNDRFLTIPRDTKLEEALANIAGVAPDNHTVYGITTKNGTEVYVLFHDYVTVFGHSVEVRDW